MFNPLTKVAVDMDLIPVLPGASTVNGFVGTTDIGKLVVQSSNNGVLALGSTADNQTFLGIVAAVPVATTPGSTVPFYVRPIVRGALYEAEYSTTYSTALPATTDIGKFAGLSNTTTIAGGSYLSMAGLGNSAGSTSGLFFKIAGVNNNKRVVTGTFNSSHLAI